jgi:hypothetical protein
LRFPFAYLANKRREVVLISPTIIAKIGDPFPKRSNKHADIATPVFNRTALRKSQHYCYRDGTIVSLYS